MPGATASIVVNVTPKQMFDVVVDFENYPEFLSDVKSVTLGKKGKNLTCEFEISVIKRFRYSLEFKMSPGKKVEWSYLGGGFFKDNKGSWVFEPEGKDKTRATYSVEVDFDFPVPSLITNKLVGSNLPSMMKKFKERAEAVS